MQPGSHSPAVSSQHRVSKATTAPMNFYDVQNISQGLHDMQTAAVLTASRQWCLMASDMMSTYGMAAKQFL